MQIQIQTMLNPQTITLPLVLIISLFHVLFLYASLKLNSVIGIFGVMIMVVSFISYIMFALPLFWFWFMVIVESFLIVLASMQYARMRAKAY